MNASELNQCQFVCFKTHLGWISFCRGEKGIQRLTFGNSSLSTARSSLNTWAKSLGIQLINGTIEQDDLVHRLTNFAEGEPDTFLDVEIQLPKMTPFQRQVTDACRAIRYGQTASYGEIAKTCQSPRAARAVGNVMRNNPIPLIVPCHRVVGSNRKLGGYSARQGLNIKRQLLNLEAVHSGLEPW